MFYTTSSGADNIPLLFHSWHKKPSTAGNHWLPPQKRHPEEKAFLESFEMQRLMGIKKKKKKKERNLLNVETCDKTLQHTSSPARLEHI